MSKDKKKPPSMLQHAVPIVIAVVVPWLLMASSPGLVLLPAMFIASYRMRAMLFAHFYAFPAIGALVYYLEKRGDTAGISSAVWPLAVPVFWHYLAVMAAKKLSIDKKKSIDQFCVSVSSFLDKKCYTDRSWPSFLYMKSERVLIAFSCIVKIALAVAFLMLYPLIAGVPTDLVHCSGSESSMATMMAWAMYAMACSTEIMYHMAMYLSGNVKTSVNDSFTLPVLCPTYWQWFFIASYSPTAGLWLPMAVECVRNISVSFFRMQDKEDTVVSPLASIVDMIHGLVLLVGSASGMCVFPLSMVYRQLSNGAIFLLGYLQQRIKRWKTWKCANTPVKCRIYIPVGHKEIECHERKWQQGLKVPPKGGSFKVDHPKVGSCTVHYMPECVLERFERKPDFSDETGKSFIQFSRKTKLPGEWMRIDVETDMGLLLSPQPIDVGLVGQFRVLHPMLDSRGVLQFFGDFSGKLFAAKKYKKDPTGGWDMDDPETLQNEAEKNAARNRHMRLIKPYFQDCLMQEKAAEFGRAFNKVENLPVRKVECVRACVMEMGWDSELPELFLVEPYLDDSVPFRKFNNNDYVPGAQAVQNTPNMFSLFTYFHSGKKLLVCDIQGKKYKFTDPQFHSSDPPLEDDGFDLMDDEEEEGRDWLHSDGGLEMMKRVLVGLHKQKALHSLCNRVWPDEMREFNEQIAEWMEDEDFVKVLKELEKAAKMYATYFNNLNPVLDAGIGGPYVDLEDELQAAMEKGPSQTFDKGASFDATDR